MMSGHPLKTNPFSDGGFDDAYPRKSNSSTVSWQQPRFMLWTEEGRAQFFEERVSMMSAVDTIDRCFWIDMMLPNREDVIAAGTLVTGGSLHPLTIEDILEMDPREKCEIFDHYLFIVISTIAVGSPGGVASEDPSFVYIVLFEHGIISMHARPISHHLSRVLRRLDGSSGGTTVPSNVVTSDWILYALLDDFVDALIPIAKALEFEVDSIDDLVLLLSQADKSDMVRRISIARKATTALLRVLLPKRELFKSITMKLSGKSFISTAREEEISSVTSIDRLPVRGMPKTLLYLRDAQDHVISLGQSLEHFMDTLNTSHANYLAQISIELTDASNRMNEVMKRLTVATAVFLPMSLIAGIFGMNVPLPFQPGVAIAELGPFCVIMLIMISLFFICAYVVYRSRII